MAVQNMSHHDKSFAPCPPLGPDPRRPSSITERTWHYDSLCKDESDTSCNKTPSGSCSTKRPTRPPGKNNGRLAQGRPLTGKDAKRPDVPGVWSGPRADLYLPYLFMRANPGDFGARPVVGPFWESPDIFILGGVEPLSAPTIPNELGQVALAGKPNTIYAHVWNFGNAAANEVIVEFYWVDPSLGISADSVHLIAQTFMSLGAKCSGRSHAMVKCPEAWKPTFVNGGHECLLVRVWDNPSDLPGEPKFDASVNRHVAQRNIHVIYVSEVQAPRTLSAGTIPATIVTQPLLLKVGPLFGAAAKVSVERVAPNNVPWLQLHTGKRGVFPAAATPTGIPALSPPVTAGGGLSDVGAAAQQDVQSDDQYVAFSTTDSPPEPGKAHVYRVSATQAGQTFGGYTVIMVG